MILPEQGSIVIIDDQSNEALPIIQALSRKGVATTYYQGVDPRLLPKVPTQVVRLVFLDLQLMETANEYQIAKSIINILEQIISPENGPYILVTWSKNRAKYESAVEEELKAHQYLQPACIIGFNKRNCLQEKIIPNVNVDEVSGKIMDRLEGRLSPDDQQAVKNAIVESLREEFRTEFIAKEDTLEIIENHIQSELQKAGVFHLFVIWENLIRRSAASAVHAISDTMHMTDLWESNMRDVIKRMAQARTGKNVLSDPLAIKAAMSTFTFSFSEELESRIRDYDLPGYVKLESAFIIAERNNGNTFKIECYEEQNKLKLRLTKDDILVPGKNGIGLNKLKSLSNGLNEPDKSVVDGLILKYINVPHLVNTKLHIESNPSPELMPGNIYKIDVSEDKKKEYLTTYFDKVEPDLAQYIFVELEVSPICDYAQTKWKKSRLVSGILYPEELMVNSSKEHLYPVQPSILFNNKPHKMVFDHHLFKSLDKGTVEQRPILFRLKRELLLDIIAQLSSHVNRPGISFMQ